MSNKSIATIATMGIDIGKNSFHVGLDRRGAIVGAATHAQDRTVWVRTKLFASAGN